ncbi:MAG: NAD(P)H-quinone oxidoreductase [Clostridia bacterium]|nr:NAD(P)H-quinone oxidoreductase [Clostridia bacterium]
MKAILINDDKSLRWDTVPDPVCNANECIIKIEAAAINRADLLQRDGGYPPPPGAPEWMGLEVAGTILEIGSEAKKKGAWSVGDKVCALLGGGGYAEYVAVRYDMLMPVPKGCSTVEAAALPEAFATSYLNLFSEGGAKAGDTLLLTGANSGLASVMIPMAKTFGLRVIATVRSEEKKKAIEAWGADRIVNTSVERLPDVLNHELEDGNGVDLAIDCLGGRVVGDCLPYLNRGARWIMIASLAGDLTEVNLKTVYLRGIRLIGSTLRSRSPEVKAEILGKLVRDVWPKIESGDIKPFIHKTFPITEAEAAQALLYRSKSVGKVVLTLE